MSERTVTMLGAVPIPVGHQVECVLFARDVGVFSKDLQIQANEPLIQDLDTGVYYGREWHFARSGSGADYHQPRLPHAPAEAIVAERFVGRVTRCIVWCHGITQHQHAGTTLVLEVEG